MWKHLKVRAEKAIRISSSIEHSVEAWRIKMLREMPTTKAWLVRFSGEAKIARMFL